MGKSKAYAFVERTGNLITCLYMKIDGFYSASSEHRPWWSRVENVLDQYRCETQTSVRRQHADHHNIYFALSWIGSILDSTAYVAHRNIVKERKLIQRVRVLIKRLFVYFLGGCFGEKRRV